jgi:molybdenum cofactor synthesis domain-containing protein
MMIRAAIVTISDSAVVGMRKDASGPALEARANELGWTIVEKRLVPDEVERISNAVADLCPSANVILTTGGTGVAPRDVTPEAIRAIADKELQGFGELMRSEGRKVTKLAPLSRGSAFTRGKTVIVTLPGSPRGAVDSLNAVCELIPHVVDLLHGRTEHVDTQLQKPRP